MKPLTIKHPELERIATELLRLAFNQSRCLDEFKRVTGVDFDGFKLTFDFEGLAYDVLGVPEDNTCEMVDTHGYPEGFLHTDTYCRDWLGMEWVKVESAEAIPAFVAWVVSELAKSN